MVVGGVALLPLPPAGAVGLAVGREAGQPGERGVWLRDIVPPSFGSIPSSRESSQAALTPPSDGPAHLVEDKA